MMFEFLVSFFTCLGQFMYGMFCKVAPFVLSYFSLYSAVLPMSVCVRVLSLCFPVVSIL